jgi:PAS domain S-box-containing protein
MNDGSIILTASCNWPKGFPLYSTYSAAKAALRSFARTGTTELQDRKIRTNVISPGAHLRILSLEDDPKDVGLIQALLEAEKIICELRRVETEAEFVAALEQDDVDLILADYTLPSFDGVSALKIALHKCPDVPFIFVSGTLGEEVAIEALKVGATDYVLKTRLSRIVPAVRRALRETKERIELSHSEEALRRSETYLAEAQKLSHTGSFGWDVSSGEIYWSQETFRIFEYQPKAKVTIEMVVQRTHPEDRSAVRQLIERVSRERTEFDFEHRLLMPDGSVKYLRIVGRPSGGLEFVGAVTDITAAKQAEVAARDKARIDHEIEIASQIQQTLLPKSLPDLPNVAVAGSTFACHSVGGDCFDVISLEGGRLGFFVGDVAGKGISAALLATLLQGVFFTTATMDLPLPDILSRVNKYLSERTADSCYATVFYGVLDTTGHFEYVNAGHVPPLMVRQSGGVEELGSLNFPIGMFDGAEYQSASAKLDPGDFLVIYSDGVSEAVDREGELFEEARLRGIIGEFKGEMVQELATAIWEGVKTFTAGAPQSDDITVLVVQYKGNASDGSSYIAGADLPADGGITAV